MAIARAALALALLICGGCHAELSTTPPGKVAFADGTDVAWADMNRALEGRWRAETPEKRAIQTAYRSVSRGSALVETFTSASGKETISVYHRDGGALMLTHYCAQGNQARLKATEATRERVVFTFLDATNVAPGQGVMKRLVFVFRPDGFDQESVYREPDGTDASTTLRFFRESPVGDRPGQPPRPSTDDGGESH
jgi:hypothetical protein